MGLQMALVYCKYEKTTHKQMPEIPLKLRKHSVLPFEIVQRDFRADFKCASKAQHQKCNTFVHSHLDISHCLRVINSSFVVGRWTIAPVLTTQKTLRTNKAQDGGKRPQRKGVGAMERGGGVQYTRWYSENNTQW